MFIGNNIRRARELKGMTQDELAKRMGYKSRSTIARIENGDNDVSQSKLKKFADILDVSIDFLLDDGKQWYILSSHSKTSFDLLYFTDKYTSVNFFCID